MIVRSKNNLFLQDICQSNPVSTVKTTVTPSFRTPGEMNESMIEMCALTCGEIQQCRQDFAQRKTKDRDILYKLWDKGANTIRLSMDKMRYQSTL